MQALYQQFIPVSRLNLPWYDSNPRGHKKTLEFFFQFVILVLRSQPACNNLSYMTQQNVLTQQQNVLTHSPVTQNVLSDHLEDFGYDSDRSPLGQDIPVASPASMGRSPPQNQVFSPSYSHTSSPPYNQALSPPYSQTHSPPSNQPDSPVYLAQSPPKTPAGGHNFAPPCTNYSPPPSNESADSGINVSLFFHLEKSS